MRIMTRQRKERQATELIVPLVATGPFATERIESDDIIQSLGAGVLFGFRKEESDQSLNLGLAYTLDLHVKTLAEGFEEGEALPPGETQIRYRETSQPRLLILLSVGW